MKGYGSRTELMTSEISIAVRTGGAELGFIERLVPAHGFALETVRIQGFNRDAQLKNLALPVVLPAALARGRRIVERFRPDVVLGVGGYVMAELGRLPEADAGSRAIVEKMRSEEAAHRATALSLGAAELPAAVKTGMRLLSRVMTTVAYRV